MDTGAYFQVGVIAGTHALKGEVRVFPMTDDPDRFVKGLLLLRKTKRGETQELKVEKARRNGKFVLIKFEGLDRIEDVERFSGDELYVHRDDAIALDEGEYYVADLIGITVVGEDGQEIGTLSDVIVTGANDVYEVRLSESFAPKKTVLLPAIKECILNVDIENRTMRVHLMEGLL